MYYISNNTILYLTLATTDHAVKNTFFEEDPKMLVKNKSKKYVFSESDKS